MNAPKIRMKCRECGRKFLISVADIIAGKARCPFQSLQHPLCGGEMDYCSEDYSDTITNTLALLQWMNNPRWHWDSQNFAQLLDTVAEDLELTLEPVQTPQQMGWVGQDGRP